MQAGLSFNGVSEWDEQAALFGSLPTFYQTNDLSAPPPPPPAVYPVDGGAGAVGGNGNGAIELWTGNPIVEYASPLPQSYAPPPKPDPIAPHSDYSMPPADIMVESFGPAQLVPNPDPVIAAGGTNTSFRQTHRDPSCETELNPFGWCTVANEGFAAVELPYGGTQYVKEEHAEAIEQSFQGNNYADAWQLLDMDSAQQASGGSLVGKTTSVSGLPLGVGVVTESGDLWTSSLVTDEETGIQSLAPTVQHLTPAQHEQIDYGGITWPAPAPVAIVEPVQAQLPPPPSQLPSAIGGAGILGLLGPVNPSLPPALQPTAVPKAPVNTSLPPALTNGGTPPAPPASGGGSASGGGGAMTGASGAAAPATVARAESGSGGLPTSTIVIGVLVLGLVLAFAVRGARKR